MHAHILHDLDDGPATLEGALAMARLAVADGIALMAATPHSPDSVAGERYSAALVRARLHELRAALAAALIPLEVLPGTELCYAADLTKRLRAGALLPYGASRAVLLECPGLDMPSALPEVVFGLQAAGYRVLLAHPERLREVQRRPQILATLVERGMLVQLTAAALAGRMGAAQHAAAEALVAQGLAHVLATDAHGPTARQPVLSEARAAAAAIVGERGAELLVRDIPRALLDDAPIPELPRPARAQRRWKFW